MKSGCFTVFAVLWDDKFKNEIALQIESPIVLAALSALSCTTIVFNGIAILTVTYRLLRILFSG